MTRTTVADPPRDARERSAWIKYQLARRGLTLGQLARQAGVHRSAPSRGLTGQSERMEHVIAAALQVAPSFLWPERYDADGNRIRQQPGPKPGARRTQRNTVKRSPARRRGRRS